MKITDYTTLWDKESVDLDRKVQDLIEKGWQPYGIQVYASSSGGFRFVSQVMVKYAEHAVVQHHPVLTTNEAAELRNLREELRIEYDRCFHISESILNSSPFDGSRFSKIGALLQDAARALFSIDKTGITNIIKALKEIK